MSENIIKAIMNGYSDINYPSLKRSELMNGDFTAPATTQQQKPHGEGKPIWDLVIEDMKSRDNFGYEKYGERLKAFNGRNALIDMYQEELDKIVYLRQKIEEDKINSETKAQPKLDVSKMQFEQQIWSNKNEFNQKGYQMLLGLQEELGELSHAHLKHEQNIRNMGDRKLSEAAKKDAVGDLFIYLAAYCNTQMFNLEEIIIETWDKVSKRDWKNKPNEDHK